MPGGDGFSFGLSGDGGNATPGANAQVYRPDASGFAPRHGRLVLTDGTGKWFDLERAGRWTVVDEASPYFGQGLYLTKTGQWVLYSPGTVLVAPSVVVVTAQDALAFILREGYDVPVALAGTRNTQEI